MKRKSMLLACMAIALCAVQNVHAQWSLTGNAGTVVATNFVGTTDNKGLVFRTNNIERMRFTPGGKLGIGLTTPISPLNVSGNVTTSLTGTGYIVSGTAGSYNLSLDNNELQARYDSAASVLYLNYWGGNVYMAKSGGGSSPLIYANSGNSRVGINGYDVTGYTVNIPAASSDGSLFATAFGSGYATIHAEKTGQGNAGWIQKTDASSISTCLFATTNGTGAAVYASSIGSGANGILASGGSGGNSVYGSNPGGGGYAGYFTGNVYTTGAYQTSDRKLKNNIKDLSDAMTLINKLKPKTYEYIHEGNIGLMNLPAGLQYGLVAQDVEEVIPELVRESRFQSNWANPGKFDEAERNGRTLKPEIVEFKALNYTEFIPIMIKGMQEQDAIIKIQQQQIDQLKQMVTALIQNNTAGNEAFKQNSSSAALLQNVPNPFRGDTKIQVSIPANTNTATLAISTTTGKQLQSYAINTTGNSSVTIHGGSLAAGQYMYSLIVDGKIIDSKQMVVIR